VTTYRKEVYPSDSRKPKVVFGGKGGIQDDLARRDFTINAIARDAITGDYIDPWGGRADLERKVVRVRGGDERFDEDPLRMLRAVRFACQLGFRLAEIQISHPERLKIVSQERIRAEFVKILASREPERGIRLLVEHGLMEYVIPEFLALSGIAQGHWHVKDAYGHSLLVLEKGAKKREDVIFRLACLLHDIGKPQTFMENKSGIHFYGHQDVGADMAAVIMRRLRFSEADVKRVRALIAMHMAPLMLQKVYENPKKVGGPGSISARSIRRLVVKVGSVEDMGALLDLVESDMRSTANPRGRFVVALRRAVAACYEEKPETLVSPLDGDEIMEILKIGPSRNVGMLKKMLTEMVLDDKLAKDDKDSAREFLLREQRLRYES